MANVKAGDIPHACGDTSDAHDKRPCVRCLMEKHAAEISDLRELVKEYTTDEEHDDLWLLRYILSNGSPKASVEHIKEATEWRKKNTALIKLVREGGDHPPHYEVIDRYVATSLHKTKKDGGPVFVIRSGVSNPSKLVNAVSYEDLLDWFMFEKEKAWEICDKKTRESGRLTKMMGVNDFNHFSIMRGREKRFMKVLADSAHLAESLYPQLVDINVAINVSKVVTLMFAIAKKIMPKKTFEKLRVCPGGADISKCPFVSLFMRVEDIPTFLGGTCDCAGGCCGIPNDTSKPIED